MIQRAEQSAVLEFVQAFKVETDFELSKKGTTNIDTENFQRALLRLHMKYGKILTKKN